MNPLRIRTLTAGVPITELTDLRPIETAITFLREAKRTFVDAGYEVQTVRLATPPLLADLAPPERQRALPHLQALDRIALKADMIVSIGPLQLQNRADESLAPWVSELVRTTRTISCSIVIASDAGVLEASAATAAHTMAALAVAAPDGMANFRFAAGANIPAGTPFFPVAWHQGPASFAIGLESAGVVEQCFRNAANMTDAAARLRVELDARLAPIENLAMQLAEHNERNYLGVDASPAPGMDRSIGAAIEALTGAPFGAAGTLEACAVVTAALKTSHVRTCGYSGLMLPVLEDPVLARRATERRYGVHDLLLYSSVCGTGLDVVPIPGDASLDALTRLLRDVGALSHRLRKPLSARLFIVPGKKAGELARFNDPLLTDAAVMNLE